MKRSALSLSVTLAAWLVPLTSQAQALKDILATFVDILSTAIPLVMLLALIAFVWGAVKLIYTAGEDRERAAGRQTMIWGLVALFVMVSVWGLVEIIYTTFFGA